MKKSTNTAPAVSFGRKPPASVRWGSFAQDAIPLVMGLTDEGEICRIDFTRSGKPAATVAEWKKGWPKTDFRQDQKAVAAAAQKIGAGKYPRLFMVGTDFQCAVWRNLLAIPKGKTLTYAELARRIQRPKAVRATGSACGANPVALLVPCHRVIASDGGLGGFGGGLAVKKKLLGKEKALGRKQPRAQGLYHRKTN